MKHNQTADNSVWTFHFFLTESHRADLLKICASETMTIKHKLKIASRRHKRGAFGGGNNNNKDFKELQKASK